MNARQNWRRQYWMWKKNKSSSEKRAWRGDMQQQATAAALERKLAAAQRTIEAQAARIAELEEPLKLKAWYLARTCGDRRTFEEYTNAETFGISEWDAETPFGIALDGGGDEVEV